MSCSLCCTQNRPLRSPSKLKEGCLPHPACAHFLVFTSTMPSNLCCPQNL
eukprot:CAMPEP_0206409266 /NCGR_PEP_ID=MMETSP0294-20121207/31738_1 /ASSEMBLY_ACC=CAM_ASM_000327 /TAXON_ID=39354 /ORGANISM="Heterosigma akashiwo, Strain CCMP2393" /LENGTH=49 /DNA_ID= /DNA_START= /DNA_END= /DNA_ORIENTATION=